MVTLLEFTIPRDYGSIRIKEQTMTTIYLVRHGSTAWNEQPRFRGLADIPLSDKGLQQAAALREALHDKALTAVYSSPLPRAVQTAEVLAAPHHLPIQLEADLRSVNYGEWEGKTEQEVEASDPKLYRQFLQAIETVRFPGGESMDEMRARAFAALERIALSCSGGRVAVVTHQVVTRVLVCAVLGVDSHPYWQIGQDTACLNIIEHKKRFQLKLLNAVPGVWPAA